MLFEDKKFIANIIKKYRIKKGLTQIQLAELTDLSEQHISKLENAIYTPSLITFLKIISILQIDMKDFGINNYLEINDKKEELIKLILTSSDKELDFYLKNIKYLKNTLADLKKEKE